MVISLLLLTNFFSYTTTTQQYTYPPRLKGDYYYIQSQKLIILFHINYSNISNELFKVTLSEEKRVSHLYFSFHSFPHSSTSPSATDPRVSVVQGHLMYVRSVISFV